MRQSTFQCEKGLNKIKWKKRFETVSRNEAFCKTVCGDSPVFYSIWEDCFAKCFGSCFPSFYFISAFLFPRFLGEKGGGIQWMRGLVRMSTGKAIQWRGPGDSVNRRTLKTEKLLSSPPSRKSALTWPPTILTQMRVDEFNFLWSRIQNYIAEADADLIPVRGQFEWHGRCRCGVLLSPCFGALYLLQIKLWGWRN